MNRNAPGNKEFRVGPKCWLDLPKGVVGGGGEGAYWMTGWMQVAPKIAKKTKSTKLMFSVKIVS